MAQNIYGLLMAENINGPLMAKNIYDPPIAQIIYGPPMANKHLIYFEPHWAIFIQFDQVWTSLSILDRCFDLSINKLNIHCQKIESCNLSIIETQNIQLLVITSASDLWDHLIFCWSQAEEGKNSKKISYKNSLINMNHFQLALKKGA